MLILIEQFADKKIRLLKQLIFLQLLNETRLFQKQIFLYLFLPSYNKLGLFDLINPKNIIWANITKTNKVMNSKEAIDFGRLTIDEIIVKNAIERVGMITVIN